MPLRRWKDLALWLRTAYPKMGIVITGAEVDRAAAEDICAALDVRSGQKIFLAIQLPLQEVAGIIAGAALYIGVDTGPTHIAGVLHAPSVILAQQHEPMWLPSYNPNATLIWSKETCTCGVPGVECLAWEEGKAYRRCVYDLSDEAIHSAIAAAF